MKQHSLFIFALIFALGTTAQVKDSTKQFMHVAAAITVTNNGISLLPSFSLGRPAAIFEFSFGKNKFSIDPQYRTALDGKPWSILVWGRYKLVNQPKFFLNVGAHPAILFSRVPPTTAGASETLNARRYLATEVVPNFRVGKFTTVGMYYLYSHGLQREGVQNTHFVTLNANFSHINLGNKFFARFNPQVYYLKMDRADGYYVTASLTLGRDHFPFTVQSIVNQAIETDIAAKSDFLWNVSLIYNFRRDYLRR